MVEMCQFHQKTMQLSVNGPKRVVPARDSRRSITRHIHLTFERLVVMLLLSWFLSHRRCDCWRHDRRRNCWRHDHWPDRCWCDCWRCDYWSLRRILIWITCFIQMSNFECNKCSYIKMDQKRGSIRVAQSSWKFLRESTGLIV